MFIQQVSQADGEMLEMLANNKADPDLAGLNDRENLIEIYSEKEINLMSMAILDRLSYMTDEEEVIH